MNTKELLESKNIKYKVSGADLVIRCLSPEHEDNNPSLRVDQLTGKFNCLSCGYSGNIFKYYDITRNEMDVRVTSIKNKIREKNIEKLSIPLGAQYFTRDYRGIRADTYIHFNAFTISDNSDLIDRIIFPIYSIGGDIGSFQARRLYSDLPPKYVNYPKGRPLGFYPATPEKIMGSVILVEGVFDMLNLFDKGLTNAVSSMGLSQVSKKDYEGTAILEKYSILKLQGVSTIYIMYDGDNAGQVAANKLLPILRKQFVTEIIDLPDGLDPGNMTQQQVADLREQLYENSNN